MYQKTSFECLFVCLFVGIKPEKLYSASYWEGSKPPGSGHTRTETHTATWSQRQRHNSTSPRTCQSMLNILQVDGLALIPDNNFFVSLTGRLLGHYLTHVSWFLLPMLVRASNSRHIFCEERAFCCNTSQTPQDIQGCEVDLKQHLQRRIGLGYSQPEQAIPPVLQNRRSTLREASCKGEHRHRHRNRHRVGPTRHSHGCGAWDAVPGPERSANHQRGRMPAAWRQRAARAEQGLPEGGEQLLQPRSGEDSWESCVGAAAGGLPAAPPALIDSRRWGALLGWTRQPIRCESVVYAAVSAALEQERPNLRRTCRESATGQLPVFQEACLANNILY